ncbi:hypothetical protein F5Y10DRAFT_234045 [Nemania abortiva]|nr:hypothetical protein F5Y10DRAFT_234045 [Nemania abortiva]
MADNKAPTTPLKPNNAAGDGAFDSKFTAGDGKFFSVMSKHLPATLDIDWDQFAKDMGLKNAAVAKVRYRQIRTKLGLPGAAGTPGAGTKAADDPQADAAKTLKPANVSNKITKARKPQKPRKQKNALEDSADIVDDGMKLDLHDGEA